LLVSFDYAGFPQLAQNFASAFRGEPQKAQKRLVPSIREVPAEVPADIPESEDGCKVAAGVERVVAEGPWVM